jgi:hypothetical protein
MWFTSDVRIEPRPIRRKQQQTDAERNDHQSDADLGAARPVAGHKVPVLRPRAEFEQVLRPERQQQSGDAGANARNDPIFHKDLR